jgi:transporter family-2 protein
MQPTMPRPLAISLSVIAGALIAVQSRVNGELAIALQDGLFAALVSFGIGTVLVALPFFVSRSERIKLLVSTKSLGRQLPIWMTVGGFFGGFFVMMQGLVAPEIGVTLFTLAIVSGQASAALMVDSFGMLGLAKRKLSLARLAGAGIAIIGLVLSSGLGLHEVSGLIALPFLAGFGSGFQQAINGRLATKTDSVLISTFLNFVTGTALIAVVVLIFEGVPDLSSGLPTNPILYLGGLVGGIFIFIQVTVVRQIGVLALGLSLLLGQVVASLVLDLIAPITQSNFGLLTYLGAVLVVFGASMVVIKR